METVGRSVAVKGRIKICATRLFVKRLHKIKERLIPIVLVGAFCSFSSASCNEKDFLEWAERLVEHSKNNVDKEMNNINVKGKCGAMIGEEKEIVSEGTIMCFVSFSMPIQALVDLSKQLERIGGVFVLGGFPKGGVSSLGEKIYEVRQRGGNIPFLIDPKAFEVYRVDQVPAFVVIEGDKFDKVTGNVSVNRVVELFNQKGETNLLHAQEEKMRETN